MRYRLGPTAYGLLWVFVVAMIVGGTWLMLARVPFERLARGELETGIPLRLDAPGPSVDERFSATDVTLRGAELTISSADGELRMRIYADLGMRRGNVYTIDRGAVQFTLQNEDTLLLRLDNATYIREPGVITVRGTLTGYITEGGQYFQARELYWDEASHNVSTEEVRYIGPSIEVRGERMNIDLHTGEVRFEGPVEVGV